MVFSLQEQLVGELRPALFALIGAVALVMLVACVNVANLLLARSASREREVGLRTALGAERRRLVRQMLTESLVLAAAGGIAGLGVAALCLRGLLALVGDRIPIPRLDQVTLDLPVLAFTMVIAVATGLAFGLVPAFVSTSHANEALRDGGRHGGGRRLHRVLGGLVVAEVALSLVLLAGAGLLMRSLIRLQQTDLGFQAEGVLTATVQLPATRYDLPRAGMTFAESLSRIAALPGVRDAAGASCLPVPFACIGTSFWRVDVPKPADGQLSSSQVRPVTPGFFRTLGIPQVAGRDFADSDTLDSPPVAIVSEELVRQQFPDGSPLGRRLRVNVDHGNGRSDMEWTIVGVVGNTRSTLDGPVRQTIFLPRSQRPGRGITLFVRTRTGSDAAGKQRDRSGARPGAGSAGRRAHARGNHRQLDRAPAGHLGAARRVRAGRARARGGRGLRRDGVFGAGANPGNRRPHGARRDRGVGVPPGDRPRAATGLDGRRGRTGGGSRAHAGARAMLFEVKALDPWTFAVTALILLVVATVAAYVPARRSMRLAPLDALRTN